MSSCLFSLDYGLRNWDYRNMYYRKPRFDSHPDDCSVMTYRGHAVLKTLIRCHFSPAATTGQKYIYSGSADGRIHIWSLDGQVVKVLDRSKTRSLFERADEASDPSAPEWTLTEGAAIEAAEAAQQPRRAGLRARATNSGIGSGGGGGGGEYATTVRDVSWHSSEASIMSTAWDGSDGQCGSIAKHEWKPYGKGTSLEDAFARQREEEGEDE
jgi:WD repeat-containing protein 23